MKEYHTFLWGQGVFTSFPERLSILCSWRLRSKICYLHYYSQESCPSQGQSKIKGFCSDMLVWTKDSYLPPPCERHPGDWKCLCNRSKLFSSGPEPNFQHIPRSQTKQICYHVALFFGVLLQSLFSVLTYIWCRPSQQSQNWFKS